MVEISEWTIIEVSIAVMGIVLTPVLIHVWRFSRMITKIEARLAALEKDAERGDKAHEQIRKDMHDMSQSVTQIREDVAHLRGMQAT